MRAYGLEYDKDERDWQADRVRPVSLPSGRQTGSIGYPTSGAFHGDLKAHSRDTQVRYTRLRCTQAEASL